MSLDTYLYRLMSFGIEFGKMYLFCFLLFQQQTRRLKFTLPAVIVSGIIYTVAAVMMPEKASLFCWVTITVCTMLSAKSRLTRRLSILAYPVISVLDMTAGLPLMLIWGYSLSSLRENPLMMLFGNMLSIPLLMLFVLIARLLSARQKHFHLRFKLIVPVVLVLFAIGALETAVFTTVDALPANVRTFVISCLVLANSLCLILSVLLLRSDSDNVLLTQESEIRRKQMKLQKQHYTRLMERNEEVRAFRHDINNHIYCMRVLLDEGNLEELKAYLNALDKTIHASALPVRSGNNLLDAILGEQMHNHANVRMSFFGSYPVRSTLSDMDFCTIFFNSLSNAFEAAEQTADKSVEIRVRSLGPHLLVAVSNSAKAAPQMHKNRYVSTKHEAGHGYGMNNMLECMEKNQIQFDTSFTDGIYTLNMYFMNVL